MEQADYHGLSGPADDVVCKARSEDDKVGLWWLLLSKFKEFDMVVTAELLAQCLRTPGDFELWWPKPTGVWDAVWQCVHWYTAQFGLRKVIVCAWCFPDRQLALIMDLLWITLSLRKISCNIWCWHSPAFGAHFGSLEFLAGRKQVY